MIITSYLLKSEKQSSRPFFSFYLDSFPIPENWSCFSPIFFLILGGLQTWLGDYWWHHYQHSLHPRVQRDIAQNFLSTHLPTHLLIEPLRQPRCLKILPISFKHKDILILVTFHLPFPHGGRGVLVRKISFCLGTHLWAKMKNIIVIRYISDIYFDDLHCLWKIDRYHCS